MANLSRYKVIKNGKCTEWPQRDFTHLYVKSILNTVGTYRRGLNFGSFCSTGRRFWDTRLSKVRNAPNDLRMTLPFKCQKYPVYTKYLHQRPKFWSVPLYNHAFLKYKVVNNQNAPYDLKMNLNTYQSKVPCIKPWVPSFGPFHSTTRNFWDTRFSKSKKKKKNHHCTKWLHTDHGQLTVKGTLHTLSTYPQGRNFGTFCYTARLLRDTSLSKIGKHWRTSERP